MFADTRTASSFPTARIGSRGAGLPVEVTLIAQLGHGSGDQLCRDSCARQRAHGTFSDALDEPAATLAATDRLRGETTALHSFAVGPQGHPFHRHAGHRACRLRPRISRSADFQTRRALPYRVRTPATTRHGKTLL